LIPVLSDLTNTLKQRQELLRQADCPNLDSYNAKTGKSLKRIIFACDEVTELLDKTGSSKEQKERLSQIEGMLSTLARLGRAFGIHLILATQRPDAATINGSIRNNLGVKICGRADANLSTVILGDGSANDLIPKETRGRFLMDDGTVFQAFYQEV
jgi:S-DNA-T family DNA segregation ATPase FtsK/SpoIIIE